MRTFFTLLLLFFFLPSSQSQYLDGPRLFWDIPHFYLAAPDISNIGNQAGIGLETSFNVATHYMTGRGGFGSQFLVSPNSTDIPGSFHTTPYGFIEVGGGLYRTNTNKCATSHRSAYSVMAIANGRYLIDNARDQGGFQMGVGLELAYFYIRNMLSNNEVILRGMWFPEGQNLQVTFGFKHFLNVREMGRY